MSVASETPRAPNAWLLAARPRTLVAAVAPVLVGCGLAAHDDDFAALPALAALVGAVLIQIATNLANDYYDFVRGGDTEERVGPVRVTQAGLLAPEAVKRGMITTLVAATVVGAYLVWVGGLPIVSIGLASVASAVLYTGGPFPLAYHALGDVFVFVFFGLIAVSGTYYVQSLTWPPGAFLGGAAIGALTTAILVVNNLRDLDTDAAAGKRTLAVRIGPLGTRVEYVALVAVAFALPAVGWLRFGWPPSALAALLAFPFAVPPITKVLLSDDPHDVAPALGETARLVGAYGVLLALGLGFG